MTPDIKERRNDLHCQREAARPRGDFPLHVIDLLYASAGDFLFEVLELVGFFGQALLGFFAKANAFVDVVGDAHEVFFAHATG